MKAWPLLACLLLAGCTSSVTESSSPSATSAPPEGIVAPPPLHVGDWWNYTVSRGGSFTYVVTAQDATDYTMETDSADLAFYNLRSDVSTLGAIRKADLAGSQGAVRVQFLQFPLRDGANWTATWDALPLTVHAKQTRPGAFDLTALRANGTAYVRYSYDERTRWFSSLDFLGPSGESQFKMTLASSGGNYTGAVRRWALAPVAKLSGDFSQPEQPGTFDVPLSATDVWVNLTYSCDQGVSAIGVAPMPVVTSIAGTDARGAGGGGQPCPASGGFQGSAGAPKAPAQGGTSETWGFDASASPGTSGPYSLEIVVRTLSAVPVKAA